MEALVKNSYLWNNLLRKDLKNQLITVSVLSKQST
jgi:hypothetical protein